MWLSKTKLYIPKHYLQNAHVLKRKTYHECIRIKYQYMLSMEVTGVWRGWVTNSTVLYSKCEWCWWCCRLQFTGHRWFQDHSKIQSPHRLWFDWVHARLSRVIGKHTVYFAFGCVMHLLNIVLLCAIINGWNHHVHLIFKIHAYLVYSWKCRLSLKWSQTPKIWFLVTWQFSLFSSYRLLYQMYAMSSCKNSYGHLSKQMASMKIDTRWAPPSQGPV